MESYAEALEAKICLAKILVSDKDVTVTSAGRGPARGYLYAKDDILYLAWTDYTSRHEFGELLRKLPKPVAAAVRRVSERCPSGPAFYRPSQAQRFGRYESIVCALTSSGHRPQRLGQAGNPLQPHPLPDSSK